MENLSPTSGNRVVRMRPLIDRVGLSKSEIYRRIQAGTFPRPIALGVRAVGWLERDVELWLTTRAKRGEA